MWENWTDRRSSRERLLPGNHSALVTLLNCLHALVHAEAEGLEPSNGFGPSGLLCLACACVARIPSSAGGNPNEIKGILLTSHVDSEFPSTQRSAGCLRLSLVHSWRERQLIAWEVFAVGLGCRSNFGRQATFQQAERGDAALSAKVLQGLGLLERFETEDFGHGNWIGLHPET